MGNWLRRSRNTGEDLIERPSNHGPPFRLVVPNHLFPDDLNPNEHPNKDYPSNHIETTKYSVWTFLPKNLFAQFHRVANIYFLLIVCLNWVPEVGAFAKELATLPLVFVLGVTAIKDGLEDYNRYRSDKRVNQRSCRIYSRKEGRYVRTEWTKVSVGDFVHLSCNETIPADILILQTSDKNGMCFVETASLDGETNLKQRESVKGISYRNDVFHPVKFHGKVKCDLPNTQINRFSGSIIQPTGDQISITKNNILLRDCILRNSDFVEGIVIYAGHDTKAMLNSGGSKYKRSKLEKMMNKDIIWCVIILMVMCGFSAMGSAIWQLDRKMIKLFIPYSNKCREEPWCEGFLAFWSFIIIYQVIIPISLYVSIELIKLGQVFFITNDLDLYDPVSDRKIQCRAWNITEDLGQIQYVFCDKTGTLTENKMVFKRCSIGGVDYSEEGEGVHDTHHQASVISQRATVNSKLRNIVSTMNLLDDNMEDGSVKTQHSQYVQDFFLAICLCNTVVVSHLHHDQMDDSGVVHVQDGEDPSELLDMLGAEYDQRQGKNPLRSPSVSALSEASLISRYEAESPDELTLVKAACAYSFQVLRRTAHHTTLFLPHEGEIECKVLHTLHFNSYRQCMSVIVEHPGTREIVLYCKGADSRIFENLADATDEDQRNVIKETERHIKFYAESSLRTMCMAKRVLTKEVYSDWLVRRLAAEQAVENSDELLNKCAIEIEQELELIGATGIEDCLQDGVPQTISSLREAGMIIWMITGDKKETAVNIAQSCKLVMPNQLKYEIIAENANEVINILDNQLELLNPALDNGEITVNPLETALVVEGKTLAFILKDDVARDKFAMLADKCTSVVCCRTTPLQKAAVVGVISDKLKKLTLAIGDGANDVNMIQRANVGIGISGLEGMQAAMASDFSIARFKFLEKLLLVHGHWCYDRLGAVIAYNFYKCSMFIMLLFWYQAFNGFSGSVMIDQYYLMLFNVCFTTLTPIIQGVLDQDVKASTLLQRPILYKQGIEGTVYTRLSYLVCTIEALWTSLVVYFIPHLTYRDSDIGMWEFGTTICAACVLISLLQNGLEFRAWTYYHVLSIIASWICFMGFAMVFNALCTTCSPPSNPFWVMEVAVCDGKFWFTTILSCTLALLPRYTTRAMMNTTNPSEVLLAKVHDRMNSRSRQRLVEEVDPFDSPTSYTVNGSRPS